jgi:thiol-disulfide isomerase/thioredoxin
MSSLKYFAFAVIASFACFGAPTCSNLASEPNAASTEKVSTSPLGALHLVGGDVYQGEIGASSQEAKDGALVWRCPSFGSDLFFPWESVERFSQPVFNRTAEENQRFGEELSKAPFLIEFQNGEAVTGDILGLDEQAIQVASPLIGRKEFPTISVRSILRMSSSAGADDGAVLQSNWKQVIPALKKEGRSKWFSRLGAYETETAGTAVSQTLSIPDMAAIDIHVAWSNNSPNWMLTVGDPRKLELHVRKLENRNVVSLTLLVEEENSADIASAQISSEELTSLSLRILCDSNRGRLVLVQNGTPIAQIRMSKGMRLAGPQNVMFTNIGAGRISLKELKIYRSVFAAPPMKATEKEKGENKNIGATETLLRTGETFMGSPTAFDSSTRSFGFTNAPEGLGRVAIDQVDRIEFPVADSESVQQPTETNVAIELWNGARYVGRSVQYKEDKMVLAMGHAIDPIQIPQKDIKSMAVQRQPSSKAPSKDGSEPSKLAMKLASNWAVSVGMIDRVASPDGAVQDSSQKLLFWKPSSAMNSVPLSVNVTGTIEPIANKSLENKNNQANANSKKVDSPFGRALKADEPSLFLKSGDCFPATIESLDESQLLFKSSEFSTGRIDLEWLRGIRLATSQSVELMDKSAKKRLLTLPRAQRNNPPKHLIVSREGDAVRGLLKSMTTDVAVLEVRGEDRNIYTKNVSEIVWLLDAPEITPPGAEPKGTPVDPVPSKPENAGEASSFRCQALYASGTRISIIPQRYEDGILYGNHPQLGECQLDVAKISRFVLGDEIQSEAQRNRFGKWKLENAMDPKFVNDLDSVDGSASAGQDSPHEKLIGKVAPDFELKKLDGNTLRLSELKGQIVILDFWATWCGPCVASLPRIVELSQEYKGAEVELVTVNIEQKPSEIQALLDRLEIKPTVVLDSDGAVARAYMAEAIPQTVIIDREGNVSHVIIGGGDATEKKVRQTLDSILDLKL